MFVSFIGAERPQCEAAKMVESGFGPLWYVSPWNAVGDARGGRRIVLHDTTLRDGEQQAGIVFVNDQKVAIATALDRMGVDRIEAGMIVSQDDSASIRTIVSNRKQAEIWSIVRSRREEAKIAVGSGVDGVGVIIFSNEQHRRIFGLTLDEAIDNAVATAEIVRAAGLKTTLLIADSPRYPLADLARVVDEATRSGVFGALALMDTFGSLSPFGAGELVAAVRKMTPLLLEFHGHNDFGLAVANSLAALCAGAEIIHATVLGLGERVGNAALEELILSAKVLYGAASPVDMSALTAVARLVQKEAGIDLAPHKPVVGKTINHIESAGIARQVASWMDFREPMQWMFSYLPELTGGEPIKIVLGKGSGLVNIEHALARTGRGGLSKDIKLALVNRVQAEATRLRRNLSDAEFDAIAAALGV
jgi:isopropylmalate/homocitrate/citramalate synthase